MSLFTREGTMLDMNPKHSVSIHIRSDGKVVWVDIDGVCKLRASNIPLLKIQDDRPYPGLAEEDDLHF